MSGPPAPSILHVTSIFREHDTNGLAQARPNALRSESVGHDIRSEMKCQRWRSEHFSHILGSTTPIPFRLPVLPKSSGTCNLEAVNHGTDDVLEAQQVQDAPEIQENAGC